MIWADRRAARQAPLCDGLPRWRWDSRVREHARATHVRLTLSWLGTLETVVPRGYTRRRIPAVIEGKREWLSVVGKRLRSEVSGLAPELFSQYPQRICLRALERTYRVSYVPCPPAAKARVTEEGSRLIVHGATAATEVSG